MATNPQAAHRHGYEKTDASPRGLVYFALIIVGILVLAFLSLRWLFGYFQKAENPGSLVAAPFADVRPLPPAPRIQSNPGADMQSYFQSQQNLLNTYGWIDRQNGIVRLPIDRAMELVLQRGLPARSSNAQTTEASGQRENRPASSTEPGGGPAK
jgi:hypothetical protein